MKKEKKQKYEQDTWDIAKDMFLLSAGSYFLSIALAYVIRAILAYIVFPGIGAVVPSVDEFFTHGSREEREAFNIMAYDICLLVSFFISMYVLAPFASNMKTIFIKFEKGEFISPWRGMMHHFKYNGECMFMVVLEVSVLSVLIGEGPFAILFRYFDTVQSVLLVAVLTFAGELICILPAQKRWFIDYYIGED